jgi:hypothetical protein
MRTLSLVVLTSLVASVSMPVMAQQQSGTPPQAGPTQQTQSEADKGIKTKNSGESGLVGDQEKPAASAHPPGQPNNNSGTATTGSNMNSSQADYNASLKDGSAPSASKPAAGGKE